MLVSVCMRRVFDTAVMLVHKQRWLHVGLAITNNYHSPTRQEALNVTKLSTSPQKTVPKPLLYVCVYFNLDC